jgi:hypothetical protein
MNYRIERHLKEIDVFYNNEVILKVKYRDAFFGRTIYQFYKNERLILETTYLVSFFRTYIYIEVQNLEHEIELKRNSGNYSFIHKGKQLVIKKKYFKNPIYHLIIDENIVGGVSIKLWGITETPTIYNVEFYEEDEENFYLLLLFIASRTTDLVTS